MVKNYTRYIIWRPQLWFSCSMLIVNRGVVSPTLDVNPTSFVIPCRFRWRGMIIDLQSYNYYHLPRDHSSKFHPSVTILHHKLLTKEGRILATGWTHPTPMTILIYLLFLRSVVQKVTMVTLNAIMILNIKFSILTTTRDPWSRNIIERYCPYRCKLLRILCWPKGSYNHVGI